MSIVELKKAIESDKAEFGVKQALRNNPSKVFISNDAREETEEVLKKKGLDVLRLNEDKEKIAKDLKLGFLCEVFSLHGNVRVNKPVEKKSTLKRTKLKKEKKTEGAEK